MESLSKLHHCGQPLHISTSHHRLSFPSPFSSVSFRSLPPPASPLQCPSSSFRLSPLRASSPSSCSSSSSDPSFHKPGPILTRLLRTLNPLLSPVVETVCIIIAASAFSFMRFQNMPVIAAPVSSPTVESAQESMDKLWFDEKERPVVEQLLDNPNNVEALRSFLELKIRANKIGQAIQVLDRLIELEPQDFEWPLMKAHMYIYNGDYQLAKRGFEDILNKDPYRFEAYHGLAMATSESNEPLNDLVKRVEKAVEFCKKEKRNSDVRDLKLLLAQIKVMEGSFTDALKSYQALVKEEPRDFRPYLCQGIIYTLLKKKDEAEKQFEKFRRLVPKNHPYKEYLEDNMFATKFFSQKFEREGAGTRS
ncbi:protein SLOW GREEN 1, chloroplastic-like [Neltuma alba]|uniref:protein SLOW GREEN 1, chloroplastic-like n=1 Tax=Neltuma alba TaxID=207710 RepID=UPI0010A55DA3|nr:protein SLOW GREEN 1, chloroplastic-like [Prosopis alba]